MKDEGGMMKQSAGGDGDMSMSRVRSRRAALHGWQAICCMAVMTTFTLPSQASDDLFVPGITDGPTPWTHADFNNEADNFRFVIMADRTGGERGGVFDRAVDKVNLLQPEFVISVGDLVDGYTTDPGRIDQQWRQFESMIARLEMPFFRVPGNHDLSNPYLRDEWTRRYGQSHYYFLYRDVLFFCLNTEDPPSSGGISDEQVDYFRDALAQHGSTARWIFVFMHRPFWDYDNKQGYERIEELLKGRRYTLFSGHHHYYYKTVIDENDHLTLATTGGGSLMRGESLGEFDHVTLVTMRDGEPRIAHLTLDGILDIDLVTESNRDVVQALRDGSWMSVAPTVLPGELVDRIPVTIHLANPSQLPMRIAGEIPTQLGLAPSEARIDRVLAPGANEELTIEFTAVEGDIELPLKDFIRIALSASVSHNGRELSAPAEHRHILDWVRPLRRITSDMIQDGVVTSWPLHFWIDVSRPNFIKEDWDWRGANDGSFVFMMGIDDSHLNFSLFCIDDRIRVGDGSDTKPQDRFQIYIAGPDDSINLDIAWGAPSPRMNGELIEWIPLHVVPSDTTSRPFHFALPLEWLREKIGDDLSELRVNIAWTDVDDPLNTKPSVLWWQPPWDNPANVPGSGTFRLLPKASTP
jgi:hypothetical protein